MDIKLNKATITAIERIHVEVYKRINQQYIDVFLCGGTSNSTKISIRDIIRDKLSKINNVRVLYPEDLFIEILNNDKESDLLTLERFLADNCDVICIICESAGALVELGAFSNNTSTFKKVVAVLEENKKKQKSFIMLGPVKLIKKHNKNNVVYYSKDHLDKLSNELRKTFFKLQKSKDIPINTIVGLYYIIPMLLYFFNTIELNLLISILKHLYIKNGHSLEFFDTLFKSSLKLLYKEKIIHRKFENTSISYSLTNKGYDKLISVLKSVRVPNRTSIYDSIRFGIMHNRYYTNNTASLR